MRVLGIETSCDETGLAIYDTERGILSEALYSQIDLHAEYGGVVPELASRDHLQKAMPLIRAVCRDAQCPLAELDGIAYTAGPGLLGALMVGAALGQSIAMTLNKPVIGVHHMEGHLLAALLDTEKPQLPFIGLLVSGGHTLLILVEQLGRYQILGQTLDDAVGEAFDKTAKLMGLPYPGGPALAALAEQGDAKRFPFPRPMTSRPGLDFSFSGLKTFVRNTWQNCDQFAATRADIAAGFQQAVVDTLTIKCRRALKTTGCNQLVVAGGVGANQQLRQGLRELLRTLNGQVFYPSPALCTDNGAMIAHVGALRLQAGQTIPQTIEVFPRWPLSELVAI